MRVEDLKPGQEVWTWGPATSGAAPVRPRLMRVEPDEDLQGQWINLRAVANEADCIQAADSRPSLAVYASRNEAIAGWREAVRAFVAARCEADRRLCLEAEMWTEPIDASRAVHLLLFERDSARAERDNARANLDEMVDDYQRVTANLRTEIVRHAATADKLRTRIAKLESRWAMPAETEGTPLAEVIARAARCEAAEARVAELECGMQAAIAAAVAEAVKGQRAEEGARRLAAHLDAELEAITRRIPVTERLPDVGKAVLVRSHRGYRWAVANWDGEQWLLDAIDGVVLDDVVEWMPLPEGSAP